MRNSAALDQFDGAGDELVGTEGELHELELDVDGWEDETSVGDPAPASSTTTAAAPAPKKSTTAKKSTAKKARK